MRKVLRRGEWNFLKGRTISQASYIDIKNEARITKKTPESNSARLSDEYRYEHEVLHHSGSVHGVERIILPKEVLPMCYV